MEQPERPYTVLALLRHDWSAELDELLVREVAVHESTSEPTIRSRSDKDNHATRTRDLSMGRRLGPAHDDQELRDHGLSRRRAADARTSMASSRRSAKPSGPKWPSGSPTAGVELVGLGTACEYHSPDPAVLKKNIEETKAFIRLCHECGGGGVKVRPNGLPKEVPVEKTLEQIGRLAGRIGGLRRGLRRRNSPGNPRPRHDGHPNIRKIMDAAPNSDAMLCWNCNRKDLPGARARRELQSRQRPPAARSTFTT